VLNTLRPSYRDIAVRVVNDIPAQIALDGYPGPLEQVVANLVMNALIHGIDDGPQGCVTIAAKVLTNETISLSVTDNGKGIAEEDLGRIFDPFFTTRFGQGGSGLGLSIVHNLVDTVLGGRIEVRSQAGAGTTFEIVLPTQAPERPYNPA
jgi:signal transduction histidine kinase